MKIGELCRRLSIPYRHVRYVLEEGILPPGIEGDPGKGEHRDLDSGQAFWLAVVMKLKQNGLRMALAGEIANLAQRGVQGIAINLAWDREFRPFAGQLQTEHQWYVDIGDLEYLRMATTANPSGGGRLEEHPWVRIADSQAAPQARPVVIIRLDLARLAELLCH